jgi:hypothetical protein
MLGQEVAAFKGDCDSKARGAAELAENVASDCIIPLRKLLEK